MSWTKDKVNLIPEVYRDFLLALRPILDSQHEIVKINGVPLGQVFNALATKYDYDPRQIDALLQNLRARDLVDQDRLGFVLLRPRGEQLLRFLLTERSPEPVQVPQLPDFPD
jgi:hypothetical protein